MCRNVFNVWPKTILPVWPQDAERLDTPAGFGYNSPLYSSHFQSLCSRILSWDLIDVESRVQSWKVQEIMKRL